MHDFAELFITLLENWHNCLWESRCNEGDAMNPPDELLRENQALRQRQALLSQVSLSISESLDFDTVLQGVLDYARINRRRTAGAALRLPLISRERWPGEMPAIRASWF